MQPAQTSPKEAGRPPAQASDAPCCTESAHAAIDQLVERVSDAFVALDSQWRYTQVNRQAAELFGRRPEELIGKHIWTEFPEGVGQPFYQAYHRALAEQQPVEIEEYYAPWDRWFENRIFPSPDGLTIFFHDITARKRAEQALRQERDFSSSLIDSLPGVFYLFDPQRRLVRWNKNFESVTGYTAAELQRLDPIALFPPEDVPRIEQNFLAVLLHGESSVEATFMTKDGRRIPYYFTGLRVMIGQTPCMAGVGIDISERKRTEEALRDSERRYRHVVEDQTEFIVRWRPDGTRTFVNEAYARYFGQSPEQLIDTSFFPLIPEAEQQVVRRKIAAFAPVNPIITDEHRAVRADGALRWQQWTDHAIFDAQGRLVEVQSVGRDIHQRKQAEALLAGQKQVLEQITSGAPLRETLDALIRFIETQADGMLGSILLLDADGIHVRHGAAPSLPQAYIKAIDGAPIGPRAGSCGTAAFRREPVIVEDIATDPLWEDYRGLALPHGLRACWSTPIFDAQRRVLGTFALYFRTPARPTEHHLRLIEMAAYTAAIAIGKQHREEALRLSESRHRRLIESNVIGVIIADVHGRIKEANDEFLRMVGYARTELDAGQLRWDTITPEQWRATDERIRGDLLRSGVCPPFEKEYLHKDGHRVPILLTAAMLEGAQGDCICTIHDLTERKRTEEELHRLTADLLHAQDEERRRLARELHDTTVQTLAAQALMLNRVQQGERALSPSGQRLIADALSASEQVAHELRGFSYLLHPPLLDELGLAGALRDYASGFSQRTSIAVGFKLADAPERLPPEVELALFRVVQESLGNVLRHSGSAAAEIQLARRGGEVVLEVRDWGRGIPRAEGNRPREGVGLAGMRERLRRLGGRLDVESNGKGTTVRAVVPC